MEHSSLVNRLIHASLWTAITSYFFSAINLLGQIFLAKLLMPEDYGLYTYLFAIVTIIVNFLAFSGPTNFISSPGTQNDFNIAFHINVFASTLLLIAGVIGSIFFYLQHNVQNAMMFLVLCIGQILLLFSQLYTAPLQKQLDVKKISIAKGVANTLSLLAAIFASHYHRSPWCLIFRDTGASILTLAFSLKLSKMQYKFTKIQLNYKPQLKFGLKSLLSSSSEIFYNRFSDVYIKHLSGIFVLGNYYQARYLCGIPIRILHPFTTGSLFAFFCQIKDKKHEISKNLSWINTFALYATLPFFAIILLFGKDLFILIYGEKWAIAGSYFEYFSLWIIVATLYGPGISISYSMKRQQWVSKSYLIAVVVFITLYYTMHDLILPSFDFSFSMWTGYLYLMIKIKQSGINLDAIKNFSLPISIIVITMIIKLMGNTELAVFVFVLGYFTMLLLGKKKIKFLFRRFLSIYKK